jgi:AraC-like DNA-binding protein
MIIQWYLSILRYQLSFILNDHLKSNFNDYINWYRIEEAKKILESSEAEDKTIGAIAIDVGFNSQTTFYKTFKKYTGITPHKYRKEAQKT